MTVIADGQTFEVPPDTVNAGDVYSELSVTDPGGQWAFQFKGRAEADPGIFYDFIVEDLGAPSHFQVIIEQTIVPTAAPGTIRHVYVSHTTDGGSDGTMVTAEPPPILVRDGDSVEEIATLLLSTNGGASYLNAGHDLRGSFTGASPAATQAPLVESGLGPATSGSYDTMRVNVSFGLTGGGDTYSLTGRASLALAPPDRDGDGVPDAEDGCPDDAGKSAPGVCGCGVPDADSDADGVADCVDNCPAAGNPTQSDIDGDDVGDGCDNCPQTSNADQSDSNGNGIGDACDFGSLDMDGDGVSDLSDQCPGTPAGEPVEAGNGCSIDQQCPCSGPRGSVFPWKSHGEYVSCVSKTSTRFRDEGLISEREKAARTSKAANGSCPSGTSSGVGGLGGVFGGTLLPSLGGMQ